MTNRFIAFLLCLAALLASASAAVVLLFDYSTATRGIEGQATEQIIGTNIALEQFSNASDRARALSLLKAAGVKAVRQHFSWRQIEETRGQFNWGRWDEIVRQTRAANLKLVAVLDSAPVWAQRDYEKDLPDAPPDNFADYGNFVDKFAHRYADDVHYYEIWDEPNVHPGWGRRNAEPAEYARLLHLAAGDIRATVPDARIILAGLGMNLETQRPHPDYSEVLFLRGLYEAGAQNDFDIVAAKPYGMWTGPEDRRVSTNLLNFSRVILLRDEMRQHGDTTKPLWAVEMGWNALPANWEGAPSPWGSDKESVQADRLERALGRARAEWSFMGALFPQTVQPGLPATDPRWGFALLTPDFQTRPLYSALASAATAPPPVVHPPAPPILLVALLGLTALLSAGAGVRFAPRAQIEQKWAALEARFGAIPDWAQLLVLGLLVLLFYFSPSTPLNFVMLGLLVPLLALRLDLALVLVVFTIPFYLYPKTLFGGFQLSLVEVLTLASAGAWVWRAVLKPSIRQGYKLSYRALSSFDRGVIFLVILGIISTLSATNFGVANRELRVIVIEPALLYALLRTDQLTRPQLMRIVYALLSAGAAVCLIGLGQLATGDVILADGLGRVRSVWGSPNNAALFLGRLLPIAFGFALFLPRSLAKWLCALLSLLLGITLYLTYSRGALVLSVPASVGVLLLLWFWQTGARRRIPRVALGAAVVVAVVVLLGLLSTARFQSPFQEGTGTGFFRMAVWTSALRMIGDHPFFGVGPDNFLYEYPKYILPEAWREPNLSHPHNVVLDFWLSLGILGVVALFWIEVEYFRRARDVFRRAADLSARALAAGLIASMVDFLAHGMIDASFFVIDLAFIFMLSIAIIQAPGLVDGV